MEKLFIDGTEDTPEVLLDPDKSRFIFSGKSIPEDVSAFYGPVLKWIDLYKQKPNNETVVDFKMEYFNTASSKIILDILMKFEEIQSTVNKLKVNWHFSARDLDMKDAGEEYADIVEVPFDFVTI